MFGKGNDMTAINRLERLYSVSSPLAQLDERELGLCLVTSSIDKQKRGNCVIDTGKQR